MLMSCGGEGATAAPPDLLMLNEGTSLVHGDDPMEGLPLLPRELFFLLLARVFTLLYLHRYDIQGRSYGCTVQSL